MLSILATLLLGAAAPAPAPVSTNQSDLQCAALFFVLVDEAKNADDKNSFTLGAVYFVGRIEGRSPGFDLEAELGRYSASTSVADVKAQASRCAAEFGAFGQRLTDIGNHMQGK